MKKRNKLKKHIGILLMLTLVLTSFMPAWAYEGETPGTEVPASKDV